MPKNHVKFHSSDGRRLILVADDDLYSRMHLGDILQYDYHVIYAFDGEEALEKIIENQETLSMALISYKLPKVSGIEIIEELKTDEHIHFKPPVIMTSEAEDEVDCLRAGSMDFIPKPFPRREIVLARILKAIELAEDRDIIHFTERDEVTGLYNKEYFYRYAEQYDHHHTNMSMDALVVDFNHFHIINERYGKAYGDHVLRTTGQTLRQAVIKDGGIVCRRENDTFLIYTPHRRNYQDILDQVINQLSVDDHADKRILLRMGVYAHVDKSIEVPRRFDRAKRAADTLKNGHQGMIAEYSHDLHEKALFELQLLEDFHKALKEKQFLVYYQPKFDIRSDAPTLASAEALVRWKHPDLGMLRPDIFIPLCEENGLIRELDTYVWERTATQLAAWKEIYPKMVPVSVNVSRIDLYDPDLVFDLQDILQKTGLEAQDLLLEITESAYTQDSEQIVDIVRQLRSLGFKVEMDDFGSGYSSLNMISKLPIDALKLDMEFIHTAFNESKDTHILEVVIEIANYLKVPVIAEGVETEEQIEALKALGCDIVQGFYYARPLPPEEYEIFLKACNNMT